MLPDREDLVDRVMSAAGDDANRSRRGRRLRGCGLERRLRPFRSIDAIRLQIDLFDLIGIEQAGGLFRAGLRTKFITAFALQTLIIAAGILVIHQWLVRRAMERQTVLQARAIARSVESTAGYYVIFGLTADLENIITDLRKNP